MKMALANPVISKQQDKEALIEDFRAAARRHLDKWVNQLTATYFRNPPHALATGQYFKRHSVNPKTLHTMQRGITLERPYFYCRSCKGDFYPIDYLPELAEEAYQYDMQKKMLRLAAKSP
jgi:hypothetical protein